MQHSESLNLQELINNNTEYVDNTEGIRKVKHSLFIRDDIRKIEQLKLKHADLRASDKNAFDDLCRNECSFLFNQYTDIFNKICNDEIDLDIMSQLLQVMKMIEDGQLDQNDGSVMVGKILKDLYVDSALKRSEKLDQQYAAEQIPKVEGAAITWAEWKANRGAKNSAKSHSS